MHLFYILTADNKRKAIKAAITDLQKYTCLRFNKRKNDKDYIHFQKNFQDNDKG